MIKPWNELSENEKLYLMEFEEQKEYYKADGFEELPFGDFNRWKFILHPKMHCVEDVNNIIEPHDRCCKFGNEVITASALGENEFQIQYATYKRLLELGRTIPLEDKISTYFKTITDKVINNSNCGSWSNYLTNYVVGRFEIPYATHKYNASYDSIIVNGYLIAKIYDSKEKRIVVFDCLKYQLEFYKADYRTKWEPGKLKTVFYYRNYKVKRYDPVKFIQELKEKEVDKHTLEHILAEFNATLVIPIDMEI